MAQETITHSLWTLLSKYKKVEIPIIQRDYAQGRDNENVKRIRTEFLSYLVNNLINDKAIELDFVYGSEIASNEVFIPLDGQQRLTTLFILHWYIAYRENRLDDLNKTLKHFCYETRSSARDFVSYLCSEKFPQSEDIVAYIKDEANWFNSE